jgi:hypothetical protein
MRLLFILLPIVLFSQDFITKMEYANMLYHNARGIGCHKCHGEKGEGKILARYKHRGKKMVLDAPSINDISKEQFFRAFKVKHRVMPTYFLTDNEIETLYYYVTNTN